MKAILFVILNVSVCFPRGSVGLKSWFQGGLGVSNEKNFPGSLSLAMTPTMQHTYNFYPAIDHAHISQGVGSAFSILLSLI